VVPMTRTTILAGCHIAIPPPLGYTSGGQNGHLGRELSLEYTTVIFACQPLSLYESEKTNLDLEISGKFS